jgi:hypothetical protein
MSDEMVARRARGVELLKELDAERQAETDPTVRALLNVKSRLINRLYGLGTKSESQQGSIAALDDAISIVDDQIKWTKEKRDE